MALGAEEGRDKLRKAAGRSTYPLSRRYPNGETRQCKPLSPYDEYIVIRREPAELKHLSRRRKRKKNIESPSSGERKGTSPNRESNLSGLRTTYAKG